MKRFNLTEVQGKNVIIDISKLLCSEVIYINATELAKQFNKDLSNYTRRKDFNDYIAAFNSVNSTELELIKTKEGKYGGTYIHSNLIVHFLRWLDVEFAVKCDMYIKKQIQDAHDERVILKAKAEQNKANQQWVEARNTNKKKHISLTDAVKALCENAESQRGYPYRVDEDGEPTNKPCPYYALIQNNIIYKKLGIDTPKKCIKKGDTLTGLEIEAVTAFEEDIAVKIMELLETKKHYKKIYKALKKLEPKVSLL